jgi:hypothetical protein
MAARRGNDWAVLTAAGALLMTIKNPQRDIISNLAQRMAHW